MTEIILLASSITLKKFNQHDDNHTFTILLYHLTFLKTIKFNKKAVYKKLTFLIYSLMLFIFYEFLVIN